MNSAIQRVNCARRPAWQHLMLAALTAGLLTLSPAAGTAQSVSGAAPVSAAGGTQQLPTVRASAKPPAVAGGAARSMARAGAASPMSDESVQRLRTLLQSLHGFERKDLDALGGDVAAALKGLVAAGSAEPLLRRQAVKALALYPTDDTFAFLITRLDTPEPREKRLVLTVLGAFASRKPQQVRQIVQLHLADPNITVRYAALGLSSHLPRTAETWNLLRARLPQEQDAGLRRAIENGLPDLKPAQ